MVFIIWESQVVPRKIGNFLPWYAGGIVKFNFNQDIVRNNAIKPQQKMTKPPKHLCFGQQSKSSNTKSNFHLHFSIKTHYRSQPRCLKKNYDFAEYESQAPFFFWSLEDLTSFVSILGAMAIAMSSWKSSLQA